MGDKSAIEWTDASWNPVTGCDKVSPGCAHCYAETQAIRFWKGRAFTDVQCHEDRLVQPLHWRRPRKVFVNSMSDLFHEDVPDAFIDQVFNVMAYAPQHTFQVLTKRAARMRSYLAADSRADRVFDALYDSYIAERLSRQDDDAICRGMDRVTVNGVMHHQWPLPNVVLMVSAENQRFADERIPLLLETPAAVRGVSLEPLLGQIDLTRIEFERAYGTGLLSALTGEQRGHVPNSPLGTGPRLDWVIVGGESGPKARPMQLEWAESIIAQCRAARVPVFVKQLGSAWRGISFRVADGVNRRITDRKGGDPAEWPEDLRVREYPEARRHLLDDSADRGVTP